LGPQEKVTTTRSQKSIKNYKKHKRSSSTVTCTVALFFTLWNWLKHNNRASRLNIREKIDNWELKIKFKIWNFSLSTHAKLKTVVSFFFQKKNLQKNYLKCFFPETDPANPTQIVIASRMFGSCGTASESQITQYKSDSCDTETDSSLKQVMLQFVSLDMVFFFEWGYELYDSFDTNNYDQDRE